MAAESGRSKGVLLAGVAGCLLVLSALTVVVQFQNLFDTGAMQIERHVALLENESLDPWQFRVLSTYLLEGYLYIVRELGWSRDPMSAMLIFRGIQNLLLFGLAWLYYRTLRMQSVLTLIGLAILAWGMGQAYYESDLSFNLYFDLIFFLLAAVLISRRRDVWLIPLSLMAMLNRETSLLIPFLLLAARVEWHPRRRLDRRVIAIAAGALSLQIAAYLLVRWYFGPKEQFYPHGVAWGWDLLRYNVGRWETWVRLGATFSIMPLLSLALFRRWPDILRRYFWTVVPVWMILHSLLGVLAETRILLGPYVLVLLPGALVGAQSMFEAGPDDA